MHIWSLTVTMTIWLVFKHAPSKSLFSGLEAWLPRQPIRMYIVSLALLLDIFPSPTPPGCTWKPKQLRSLCSKAVEILASPSHYELSEVKPSPSFALFKRSSANRGAGTPSLPGLTSLGTSLCLIKASSSTVQMILYGMLIAIT